MRSIKYKIFFATTILFPLLCFGKVSMYIVSFIKRDTLAKLYIDPTVLTDEEKSLFVEALGRLAINKNIVETIKINKGQKVVGVIDKGYNISVQNTASMAVLAKQIKEINNLNDKYVIYEGKYLNTPVIPKSPTIDNSKKFIQVTDLLNGKTFISTTENSIKDNPIIQEEYPKEKAGLWMYNLDKKDLSEILNFIPKEIQNKLYGEAYTIIEEIPRFAKIIEDQYFNDNTENITIPFKVDESEALKRKLSEIRIEDFGTYYIIDYLSDDKCSHGNNVLSVIKQRLKEYSLDSVNSKIIPIQIDFFSNPKDAIRNLEKILNENQNLFKISDIEFQGNLNNLKKLTDNQIEKFKKDCSKCVPETFADILLKHYYSTKPDIISTSIWLRTNRSIKPNFTNSSNTNFITAALNEQGSIIEDLAENGNNSIEPLLSCYTSYSKFGSIIVGNKTGNDEFSGMYSNQGQGVSTLGIGIGYDNLISCFGKSYKGTSFATPDVAVKLLIAKAYWRRKNLLPFPNALESRIRLLMSSDLDLAYIGKFASAGLINLEKLLVTSPGFVEDNLGNINENIIIDNSSSIWFNESFQKPFKRDVDGICGLAFINGKTLAFFESILSWKEIKIDKISLLITKDGITENLTDINEIAKKYKQIITLKNF